MLTGKRFELTKSTLALDVASGKRNWVTIPAGAVIKVVAGPNGEGDRMVDVLWERRPLVMFAIDLTAGGIETQEQVRPAGV
jgi:hypothetical protein